MKIAIISDTHDNFTNLKTFFEFAKKEKIETIIHCGDVCRGETLKEMERNFKDIYLSLGNRDIKETFQLKDNLRVRIFESFGEVEIEKIKIAFCHFPSLAERLFEKNYDFLFFGHTHKPHFKKENGKFLVNPGNLAGLYFKAGFALLDTKTKKLEFKILEEL